MNSIFLIAGNYVREQRWLVILLLVWVFISGVALGVGGGMAMDDALFFVRQQAVYGVAFAGFLAASAIHNERRSRRILPVLSKGIERRQYLAGLLAGIAGIEGLYGLAMGVAGEWALAHSRAASDALWWMLLALFVVAMLVATVALFFSTVLNPLFTLAATAVVLALPAAVRAAWSKRMPVILPAYDLIAYVMGTSLREARPPDASLLALAAVEMALFWLAAAWVFARRDIAVAVE